MGTSDAPTKPKVSLINPQTTDKPLQTKPMPTPNSLQLISYNLCPFVQRSVILLNEKGAQYDLTFIDISNKPDWFLEISPLGKVPVLRVDDTVIFESAVIAEYLDETVAPALHPRDPLAKASHRAWIEYSSTLLMTQHRMHVADNPEEMDSQRQALRNGLDRLTDLCDSTGPFFAGQNMSLIDTAIAPLFMRIDLVAEKAALDIYPNERIKRWAKALSERPSVQQSVVDDFGALFYKRFENEGGYLFLALL